MKGHFFACLSTLIQMNAILPCKISTNAIHFNVLLDILQKLLSKLYDFAKPWATETLEWTYIQHFTAGLCKAARSKEAGRWASNTVLLRKISCRHSNSAAIVAAGRRGRQQQQHTVTATHCCYTGTGECKAFSPWFCRFVWKCKPKHWSPRKGILGWDHTGVIHK